MATKIEASPFHGKRGLSSCAGRVAGWAVLLLWVGCCGGDLEEDVVLETGPLLLPAAEAATGVPASWFLTVGPMEEVQDRDLEACTRGTAADLPLRFAVVEVGQDRIVQEGLRVMDLDRGLPGETDTSGFLLEPLYDTLLVLRENARQMAAVGCQPWTHGPDRPPAALREAETPPLLLAVDFGVPARTLAQVIYTAGQAGFDAMALWVDDPTPDSVGAASPGPASSDVITILVEAEGVRWALGAGGVSDTPAFEDVPLVVPAELPDVLGEHVDRAAPPSGVVILGEGSTGAHIQAQDALAGAGIHCTIFVLQVDGPETASGSGGEGTGRTLTRSSIVPVLPIVLPRIPPPGGGEGTGATTITGQTCPSLMPLAIEGTSTGTTPDPQ